MLVWWLLAAVMPAFANNPPTADGMLGVLLLFPVVMLALRFSGAKLPTQRRSVKVVIAVVLTLATILTLGGTELALIPLILLLVYGVHRGISIMRYGEGGKRFAIGSFVILYLLFAIANYLVSLGSARWMGPELQAKLVIQRINRAEQEFRASGKLDVNRNGVGEYGTIDQLVGAGLQQYGLLAPGGLRGYRFMVVLSGDASRDEKQYFVYASPVNYGTAAWSLALWDVFRPPRYYARQTFASDETGVIRQRDLGASRAVTRDETATWPSH